MIKIFVFFLMGVLSASSALAHGIQLNIEIEGGQITGTAHYSRSKPVRDAQVRLLDVENGQLLVQERTDQEGRFSPIIPEAIMEHPVDLSLVVDDGAGHRARRTLAANTLKRDAPSASASQTRAEPKMALSEEQLSLIVERAVQRQLEPLYEQLADDHTHLSAIDVFAGIGYLVGVGGLIAWVRSRRQSS